MIWFHYHGNEADKKLVRNYLSYEDIEAVEFYIVKLAQLLNVDIEPWVRNNAKELLDKSIKICTLFDEDYPKRLRLIYDYPFAFFYIGDLSCIHNQHVIAIVGTRKPTYDAIKMCDMVTNHLSKGKVTIVSGLAFGVDALAHRGALTYGAKTVAILASGVDTITPKSHYKLAKQIIDHGGLILSEYPPGTQPLNHYFVARNRLVSGISTKVFIVEAGLSSGSMTTSKHALDQNKELYVMPGSISNLVARGTNSLFIQGAYPVVEPEDLLMFDEVLTRISTHPIVMRLKEEGPISLASLAYKMDMPLHLLMGEITLLECEGLIRMDEQLVKSL